MNEKWLVVGFRPVNFTDEKTKKNVSGYTLYLLRDPKPDSAAEENVHGQIVEKLFISSEYVNYKPDLNDEIVLLYNKYGKVGSIQVV